MPYQKILIYCVFVWCISMSMAQEVIATSGLYGTHSSGSLSITIGETITETAINSSGILTQGFQQKSESILTLPETEFTSILLYPNPFTTDFFVDGSFDTGDLLMIYDMNFRLIFRQDVHDCNPCTLSISENSASEYLIYHVQPGKQPRFVGTLIHTRP